MESPELRDLVPVHFPVNLSRIYLFTAEKMRTRPFGVPEVPPMFEGYIDRTFAPSLPTSPYFLFYFFHS